MALLSNGVGHAFVISYNNYCEIKTRSKLPIRKGKKNAKLNAKNALLFGKAHKYLSYPH